MRRFLVLLVAAAAAAFCADDPWMAVTKIKSDTDIRVMKKGSTQPILGKFYEGDDQRIIVVVKNQQTAISKDQIDRLDARPAQSAGRVKVDGKNTTEDPQAAKEPPVGMNGHPAVGTSSTSAVTVTGKPDFETVYRRPLGAPKNSDPKK